MRFFYTLLWNRFFYKSLFSLKKSWVVKCHLDTSSLRWTFSKTKYFLKLVKWFKITNYLIKDYKSDQTSDVGFNLQIISSINQLILILIICKLSKNTKKISITVSQCPKWRLQMSEIQFMRQTENKQKHEIFTFERLRTATFGDFCLKDYWDDQNGCFSAEWQIDSLNRCSSNLMSVFNYSVLHIQVCTKKYWGELWRFTVLVSE